MTAPQPITLQISLILDEQGNLTATIPAEGEDVTVDRAAVKASSRTCVKKSEGEILSRRIKEAMDNRDLSVADVAKRMGASRATVYEWIAHPGNCKLTTLLALCRTVGIRQLTLESGGMYK